MLCMHLKQYAFVCPERFTMSFLKVKHQAVLPLVTADFWEVLDHVQIYYGCTYFVPKLLDLWIDVGLFLKTLEYGVGCGECFHGFISSIFISKLNDISIR